MSFGVNDIALYDTNVSFGAKGLMVIVLDGSVMKFPEISRILGIVILVYHLFT